MDWVRTRAAAPLFPSACLPLARASLCAATHFFLLPFSVRFSGLTPQMGWNSWNYFHCNVSDALIRATAEAMVSTGLAQLGYNYINIDGHRTQQQEERANSTAQREGRRRVSAVHARARAPSRVSSEETLQHSEGGGNITQGSEVASTGC